MDRGLRPIERGSLIVIGLMSGTSVDAVDGVLAEYGAEFRTLAFASAPIPPSLREPLQQLQKSGPDELERAARAGLALSELYAQVVGSLLSQVDLPSHVVTAIGAHGQTVRHRPEQGYSIQLLNAARLAELTHIPVVSDLRAADLAAGGQGAPLVPAFHAEMFGHPELARLVINVGGIANVTFLPPMTSIGHDGPVILGHDTGPGNTLLDYWYARHHPGQGDFDPEGRWASAGRVDRPLLEALLTEPYFAAPPPKSTGRDLFNADWLERVLGHRGQTLRAEDVQATLTELSALTIARSCKAWEASEAYLCGGGALNRELIRRMAAHLPQLSLRNIADLGIDPRSVEAAAFAWLAARRMLLRTGNLPAVTGSRGARVLGTLHHAPGRRGSDGE
jgi:anhydro-N-acetylmuramic acid kinase